jgi:hypothetical protein
VSFWRQYPKRVDMAAALRAYRGVIKRKLATPAELLAGAMRYAGERHGQDPKYTKNPATWLNAGSWANETTVAAPINGTIINPDGSEVRQQPPPWQHQKRAESSLVEAMFAGMNRRQQ